MTRYVSFWICLSLASFPVTENEFLRVPICCSNTVNDYMCLHQCTFPGVSFITDAEMKGIDRVKENNDSASLVNLFKSKLMQEPEGFHRMANIAMLTWNTQYLFPTSLQIQQMLKGYGNTLPDVLVVVLQESWKKREGSLKVFVSRLASKLSSTTHVEWEPLHAKKGGTLRGGINLSNFVGTGMGWNTQTVIALKRTTVRVSEVKFCQSAITMERGFVGVSFKLYDNNHNFLGYHFHGGLHLGLTVDDQENHISSVLEKIGSKCASEQVLSDENIPNGLDMFDFVSLSGDYNSRLGLCDLVCMAEPDSKLEHLVKPIFRKRFKQFLTEFWQMIQSVSNHWPGIKNIFDFEKNVEKSNVNDSRLSMYSMNQQLWFVCLFAIHLHQDNTEEDIALRWLMNGNVGASVNMRPNSVLKTLRDDYNFVGSGSCPSGGFSYKYDKEKFEKFQPNSELSTYEFMLYYLNYAKLIRKKVTEKTPYLIDFLKKHEGCKPIAHIGVLDYVTILSRKVSPSSGLLSNETVTPDNSLKMLIDRQWQGLSAHSDHLPLLSSLQVGYENTPSLITLSSGN